MANFCPNCGSELNPTNKFCERCGTPIANTAHSNARSTDNVNVQEYVENISSATEENAKQSAEQSAGYLNSVRNQNEQNSVGGRSEFQTEKSSKIKGIVTLIIAIIGIIVIIFKSSVLGMFLYMIAAAISFFSLPRENRNISSIKNTITHPSSETMFSNDIFAIILALAPIAIIVSAFMYIYIEPMRWAHKAMDAYDNYIDRLLN